MVRWKKNLVVLWISQFLAMVGMSSVVPFLPLFIRELGVQDLEATATWSGFVFAGPFIVAFFASPLWGNLGDKYGRKIMTLRAAFGLGIAQLLVATSQDVYQLFAFRMLQGALSGFYPASIALVASNTPREKTGYALGMLQSATTAGTVIGPLIGGALSNLVGFRSVFLIVGGLISLCGLLVLIFVKEERVSGAEARKYTLIDNWKHVFRTKEVLTTMLMISLAAFGISVVRPIFVLYVETFNFSKANLPLITGALYSIIGVFSTLSAAVFSRKIDDLSFSKVLITAASITAAMYIAHVFVENVYVLIPVRILLGLGYGVILPLFYTYISKSVGDERKGGVLGVASSFHVLGTMTGSMIAGGLVSFAGLRGSFLFAGLVFIIMIFAARFRRGVIRSKRT